MKVVTLASELSEVLRETSPKELAFIPTMGALHEGHLSLVQAAQRDGYRTVVSIFVNPLQFNNPDDLAKYPHTLNTDLELLTKQGVDLVFTPSMQEIYPPFWREIGVELGPLDLCFEGERRPGHFHGVVQVVYRLFQLVQPNVVYFGEKDLQQCLVIRQLIQQHFPFIVMRTVATKRELSGLAMSSRNVRLSDEGREKAASIFQALQLVAQDKVNWCAIVTKKMLELRLLGIEVEYLSCISLPYMDVLDCQYFAESSTNRSDQQYAVVFAGSLEGVRLIDNLVF